MSSLYLPIRGAPFSNMRSTGVKLLAQLDDQSLAGENVMKSIKQQAAVPNCMTCRRKLSLCLLRPVGLLPLPPLLLHLEMFSSFSSLLPSSCTTIDIKHKGSLRGDIKNNISHLTISSWSCHQGLHDGDSKLRISASFPGVTIR